MKMPDFDNIDLAIMVIGIVLMVVAIGLMFKGQLNAGLGFLGGGVSAIAGLAKGSPIIIPKEDKPE
jgi:uncharacterized membrane protein YkgB